MNLDKIFPKATDEQIAANLQSIITTANIESKQLAEIDPLQNYPEYIDPLEYLAEMDLNSFENQSTEQ